MSSARILDLDPATHVRHATHQGDRIWAETNCYTDVVIELLHALGFEPLAAMAFALTVDWDVDQWTFFKFPHQDVEEQFAVALFELAPWRPLHEHVHAHVAAGRPVLVELDSWFLPDTAGTAHHRAHVKSTVAVNHSDLDAQRLGYFHNQGYFELEGDDFVGCFQSEGLAHPRMLPPYIEFLKPIPGRAALQGKDRTDASLAQLQRQLSRLPPTNPIRAFKTQMQADLGWLQDAGLEGFHTYSFATLRQYGAAYELAASHLAWLERCGVDGLSTAQEALLRISRSAKATQFQLARAMARRRTPVLDALDEQASAWDQAMDSLSARA